jgi:hypothetical protein
MRRKRYDGLTELAIGGLKCETLPPIASIAESFQPVQVQKLSHTTAPPIQIVIQLNPTSDICMALPYR